MKKLAVAISILALFAACETQAATQTVSGTIFHNIEGTTVDYWRIDLPSGGQLTVDVLAYESAGNTLANAKDLNGDGEITFLDPDTNLFHYSGLPLQSNDWILRCDDVGNSNGVCGNGGLVDGSIHTRDPYFSISLQPGSYIYAMGDYRTTTEEAVAKLNAGDTLRNGGDHGDYRITFSSDAPFSVTAVPEPETYAMMLAGLGLMGFMSRRRKA